MEWWKEVKWLDKVLEKVKEIVVEQLGVEEEEVTEKASFVDDLGADSLDIVELIMAFEESLRQKSRMKMPKNGDQRRCGEI